MDVNWDTIGKFISYLLPVIIFVVVNIFFKKQQERKRRLTMVRSLLSETNHNQKVMEALSIEWQMKKFKTETWKRNKEKLDYLTPELRSTLADSFEIIEEFNREIDSARKHKSASYLAGIQVGRLSEPLARSKAGLEEWLQSNKGKERIFNRSRDTTS